MSLNAQISSQLIKQLGKEESTNSDPNNALRLSPSTPNTQQSFEPKASTSPQAYINSKSKNMGTIPNLKDQLA